MREFKFFQKGTIDMMDDEVRATASFNADTPEGYMNRRMLYHTNRGQYDRLRHPNNEMEQYFYERGLREQRDLNDNPIRLFNTTTVTKINPKWWMKIKMGLQEMSIFFKSSPYGIMLLWALSTIGVILFISKLLNAW